METEIELLQLLIPILILLIINTAMIVFCGMLYIANDRIKDKNNEKKSLKKEIKEEIIEYYDKTKNL